MHQSLQLTVVNVDDNSGSLKAFEKALAGFPEVRYLKGFSNAEEALEFLKVHEVDILFLDVEMPSRNGLWLADQVKDKNSAIVFLTSHTQYALHAFEACALDYIVKPATHDSIAKILQKHRRFRTAGNASQREQIQELSNQYLLNHQAPKRIFVNTVGQIKVIRLDEVLYFMANTNYTIIVMKDGSRLTTSKTMRIYDETIANHPDFLRIHRSYIINKNNVSSIIKRGKQHRFFVEMSNSDRLEISYARKDEILEKIVN